MQCTLFTADWPLSVNGEVDIERLGKILGPRGLMPNPKLGTVTMDVKGAEAFCREPSGSSQPTFFGAEARMMLQQAGCRGRCLWCRRIGMRIILVGLMFFAGCDLPDGPARPAPSGITAISINGDTRFGGADQPYTARGSQNTISAPH